jgi:hypothetical protein
MRQPVLERVAHRVPPPRPPLDVQFLVECLELVADFDPGLTADLFPAGLKPRSTTPIYRFFDASQ